MASSGMLRRVATARTDVAPEPIASIIRMSRIVELGATLAVTTNRTTPRGNIRRFLQEPHGVPSKQAEFFIATAMKISNLT
jgi:hypothetical protein